MNRRAFAMLLFLVVASLGSTARAASIIHSNDSGSQDGFVYAFSKVPSAVSAGFEVFPAGQAPVSGDSHTTEAFIKFGLGSVPLTSAQVTSATLSLFLEDASTVGFGVNPSAGQPITVDLFPVTATWDRSTLKWSNKPGNGALITSTPAISGIGSWVNINLTSTVKDWLDHPLTNFGLVMKGQVPVGSSPNWVYANFSSGFGSLGHAPTLTIVPEPASMVLALCGLPLLAWQARRRLRSMRSGLGAQARS